MTIEQLLALMTNPAIVGLLATFLAPLLAGLPMFNTILNFMAGLVNKKLVDIVPPAKAAINETLSRMEAIKSEKPADFSSDPEYQDLRRTAEFQTMMLAQSAGAIDMSKILQFAPIILIGVLLFSQSGGCKPKPAPANTPANTPTVPVPAGGGFGSEAPSPEMQSRVAGIKSLATGNQKAPQIAQFYLAASDVVKRDTDRITSTNQWSYAKDSAEQLFAARTDLASAIPGLGAKVNEVLVASVGSPTRDPITPATRAKLAETLNAIAWALGG